MQPDETKVADTRGRFLRALRDGREINDATWANGRILLSNRRLVLTVLITRGEILGELLAAALLSTALLVAYTAIQGFWYGYARGKLRETRQH